MRYQQRIGQFNVVANCSDDFAGQAESLLDKLSELDKRGPALGDGMTIEFGWSLLTLYGNEEELVVHEPDFEGNPVVNSVPQVEVTLRVLTEQVTLLNLVGSEGVTAWYQDNVVMDRGCLEMNRIYLERKSPTNAHDSGWYIGRVDKPETEITADNLELTQVWQLFQRRRSLMKVLALPVGFLVVIRGEEIETVCDENGSNLWIR